MHMVKLLILPFPDCPGLSVMVTSLFALQAKHGFIGHVLSHF